MKTKLKDREIEFIRGCIEVCSWEDEQETYDKLVALFETAVDVEVDDGN